MLKIMIQNAGADAMRRTFGYYALFAYIGLDSAVTGPTLLALASQTRTGVEQMGMLFLAASIGYASGVFLSGRVFDRLRGHPVLGISQLSAAVLIFMVPFIHWFWLLLLVFVCKGVANGFISIGVNTLLVWTHRENVAPFMNGMHFFFGLGAFLAPFVVGLFTGFDGGYRWAYWALAIIAMVVGLRALTMPGSPTPGQTGSSVTVRPVNAPIPYPLVISTALFMFFYAGAEIAFGGWVYTYAVTLNLTSAAGAAYLTSAFWLSFTIGRLISIPTATRFAPKNVVLTALVLCLSILLVGILFPGSSTILWIMAAGLGFFMAPIWPTGYTLAGQSLDLTGRVNAMMLLGDSFGTMLLPWLMGWVIATAGARAMVFLILSSLALTLLAFGSMLYFRRAKAKVVVTE